MKKRLLTGIAIAALSLASVAGASANGTAALPETETLFIAAGCPQDTPGTCTSTRWLGLEPGDATSNYLTAVTPVDHVLYQIEEEPNWRDYPSDGSLRGEGYPLRADEDITATVRLTASGVAANTSVHARIDARTKDRKNVSFGPLEDTVTILPGGAEEVEFAFDVPDELEGVALSNMVFYVAVHGVNARGGYIDQEGGSTVEIPYWLEEPVDEPSP